MLDRQNLAHPPQLIQGGEEQILSSWFETRIDQDERSAFLSIFGCTSFAQLLELANIQHVNTGLLIQLTHPGYVWSAVHVDIATGQVGIPISVPHNGESAHNYGKQPNATLSGFFASVRRSIFGESGKF